LSSPSQPVEVTEVRIVEVLKTQATKVRFEVDAVRAPVGFGRQLCVKGFFGEEPLSTAFAGASRDEARYYLEIAPHSAVRTPHCRYAGLDADTGHGIIIMDDVVAAGGRFLTVVEPYSPDQTAASLDQLARLHAEYWNGVGLERFPWLKSRLAEIAISSMIPLPILQDLMDGERGRPLSPAIRDAKRIHGALVAVAKLADGERNCLVHGDAHAGNIFECNGAPALVDWQLLQRSCWALDVSYHIGTTLTVEDRAKSEQHLLRHYLQRLRAHGVEEPPGWQDAWLAYRTHMLYGYYLWGITRRVEPCITHEMVRRLGLAVTSLESFELLDV
jgi:hypothetical protein